MAWGSTVLPALDGLVTAFQAASPATTVRKLLVVGNSARQEVIYVGHEEAQGGAVQAIPGDGDYGLRSQREQFTVNCQIEVARGGTDPDPAITDAFALLNACGGALTGNPTLSGVVMGAKLGPWTLTLQQIQKGCKAVISFAVDVDSFTDR